MLVYQRDPDSRGYGNLRFFWTMVDFFGTSKCCCQFKVYSRIPMIYRYMMVKYGLSMVLANWERYDGNNLWYLIMIYIWGTMNAPPGGHGFLKLTWLLPRRHKFQFHKFGNGREALRWYTGCRCSSHHRFLYKSPECRGTGLVFGWVQRWRSTWTNGGQHKWRIHKLASSSLLIKK